MVSRLDENQDGIITANEIERMPSFVRDSWQQQGLDFNRGVRVEDLQQSAQRGMEDMRRQREEGGRGRDFERSDRPDFVPPQDMGNGGNPNDGRSSGTPTASSSSTAKKPRTRVSPLLPETYKTLDTDFDGQIALYEWRKGKRGTISQFSLYDNDGDGFLIPKELAKTVATTPTAATAPGNTPPPTTAALVAPVAPPAPVAVSVDAAVKAGRMFDLLDKDKSLTVVGSEWDRSSRLKPMFEKGGVDLLKPLNKEEFTQAFVRVGADK